VEAPILPMQTFRREPSFSSKRRISCIWRERAGRSQIRVEPGAWGSATRCAMTYPRNGEGQIVTERRRRSRKDGTR